MNVLAPLVRRAATPPRTRLLKTVSEAHNFSLCVEADGDLDRQGGVDLCIEINRNTSVGRWPPQEYSASRLEHPGLSRSAICVPQKVARQCLSLNLLCAADPVGKMMLDIWLAESGALLPLPGTVVSTSITIVPTNFLAVSRPFFSRASSLLPAGKTAQAPQPSSPPSPPSPPPPPPQQEQQQQQPTTLAGLRSPLDLSPREVAHVILRCWEGGGDTNANETIDRNDGDDVLPQAYTRKAHSARPQLFVTSDREGGRVSLAQAQLGLRRAFPSAAFLVLPDAAHFSDNDGNTNDHHDTLAAVQTFGKAESALTRRTAVVYHVQAKRVADDWLLDAWLELAVRVPFGLLLVVCSADAKAPGRTAEGACCPDELFAVHEGARATRAAAVTRLEWLGGDNAGGANGILSRLATVVGLEARIAVIGPLSPPPGTAPLTAPLDETDDVDAAATVAAAAATAAAYAPHAMFSWTPEGTDTTSLPKYMRMPPTAVMDTKGLTRCLERVDQEHLRRLDQDLHPRDRTLLEEYDNAVAQDGVFLDAAVTPAEDDDDAGRVPSTTADADGVVGGRPMASIYPNWPQCGLTDIACISNTTSSPLPPATKTTTCDVGEENEIRCICSESGESCVSEADEYEFLPRRLARNHQHVALAGNRDWYKDGSMLPGSLSNWCGACLSDVEAQSWSAVGGKAVEEATEEEDAVEEEAVGEKVAGHQRQQYPFEPKVGPDTLVFAIYGDSGELNGQHDSNMAIARGGQILAALELERLFGRRYFGFDQVGPAFETQLGKAVQSLMRMAGLETDDPAAVLFDTGLYYQVMSAEGRAQLQRVVRARRWMGYNHHEAHAAIGFYDSPFRQAALVISFDGGGNDGSFNAYLADKRPVVDSGGGDKISSSRLEAVLRSQQPVGTVYHAVAGALSAIAKGACAHSGFDSKDVHAKNCLHLAGKKMGYAALGRVREEWVPYLDDMYHLRKVRGVRGLLGDNRTEEDERDLARTSQEVFQRISLRLIGGLLARYPRVEGVVMVRKKELFTPCAPLHSVLSLPLLHLTAALSTDSRGIPPFPSDELLIHSQRLGGAVSTCSSTWKSSAALAIPCTSPQPQTMEDWQRKHLSKIVLSLILVALAT